MVFHDRSNLRVSSVSNGGVKTPTSVIMPLIRWAGVTSNAGFQHVISKIKRISIMKMTFLKFQGWELSRTYGSCLWTMDFHKIRLQGTVLLFLEMYDGSKVSAGPHIS